MKRLIFAILLTGGAMAATADNYASLSKMYFSTEATGIENVNDASQQGAARYYDLQGRMVENPAHGVFIKKVNGKTTKVVLK